ncbi:MAG: metallophosphatase [Candidatus Hydrogenedentota bacterium]
MISRRKFIIGSALTFAAPSIFIKRGLNAYNDFTRLTLLHTNDMHSHIEPIKGGKYDGLGGCARRMTLIKRLRNNNTLLLDAGDVIQGTPYFNFYKGEIEFKSMTAMGYDVMTIGNHEFDADIEGMRRNFKKFAKFEIVNSNYKIEDEYLRNRVKDYVVRNFGNVRVGIFGLGIKLQGLVSDNICEGFEYTSPLENVDRVVKILRKKEKVDFIICISHLGLTGYDKECGDRDIAERVRGIDLIIGGHTHTFMEQPELIKDTYIFQVGFAGIILGRLDFTFDKNKKLVSLQTKKYTIC